MTSKLFILNQVIGILMVEYGIYQCRPLRVTTKAHKERDEKYKEFVRNDLDYLFNPLSRIPMYAMVPFLVPKWIIAWSAWLYMGFVINFVRLYHTTGNPYDRFTYVWVRYSFMLVCRINLWTFGCWWLDY